MEKLEKDGHVAVVYSPGYGAGWSSWNSETKDILAMDKDIAQAVVSGDEDRAKTLAKEKCPDAFISGQRLEVVWLPKGTAFRISEYDGYESVEVLGQIEHQTA